MDDSRQEVRRLLVEKAHAGDPVAAHMLENMDYAERVTVLHRDSSLTHIVYRIFQSEEEFRNLIVEIHKAAEQFAEAMYKIVSSIDYIEQCAFAWKTYNRGARNGYAIRGRRCVVPVRYRSWRGIE